MDPDSILEENAKITANATCGEHQREYYCRLVEHADEPQAYRRYDRERHPALTYDQTAKSYRDSSGQWVQCSFCDANDPAFRHPIEYVLKGEAELWWQSPSLAQGLQYHSVTITMDFNQVYQIVYVLLRMGDSPRPANWILERSLDGETYKPWVFFAENEQKCEKLYQPLIDQPLTITSGPRPWRLEDDEVYCTTFYSQPQTLQSGEIIVTLSLDRASTISGPSGTDRPISAKLIDFLSARFVRLRFQKLQTLSGDWMAMPNQLESSVYNRYYYSIRTIKVGGKCVCNSHASRCEQRIVDNVPRAVCVCQHNTCGSNCEVCCPLFNQQPWRPGRICEECNCNGKADECVYNQTVANLRLSKRKDGFFDGGGVCVNCREDTTGINCDRCKTGFYRPMNVRPETPFPCTKCECNTYGSTGECVSSDAEMPERYPGDCICKEGFAGRKCDQCAEGYRHPENDPTRCVPCTCDVRGSHRGGGYQCEPPCNCKVNVNSDSHCTVCQPGFFNLDIDNPEGCQACYCSGLTDQCDGVSPITAQMMERNGMLGAVSSRKDWELIIPSASPGGGYAVSLIDSGDESFDIPLSAEIHTVEAWLTSGTPRSIDRGYYWSAPALYLGNQITAYRGILTVILRFHSPTMISYESASSGSVAIQYQLDYMWFNEPDIVLEGNGYRLAYILPSADRKRHLILNIPLHESSFRVLVEPPSTVPVERIPMGMAQGIRTGSDESMERMDKAGRPATLADLMLVLSKLDRLLIKAKYIRDQTDIELLSVQLQRAVRGSSGGIPNVEECACPVGHTGTSCESCAFGFWRDPNRTRSDDTTYAQVMWRSSMRPQLPPKCVPCQCHGHSAQCDEDSGECMDCQHNTAGAKCDICAPGYYGDPTTGAADACQPCACPTLSNQKSQTCLAHEQDLTEDRKPYVCVDCEKNTRGRYCEICAEGYFGSPADGIECKKCDCGRGAIGCNSTTGVCICGFNTAGARCDVCAEGTHGDPSIGQMCKPCNCHAKGSVSPNCRPGDGQCTCRPGYEGLRCERCEIGRGNVEAGCPPCQCDPMGTRPNAWPACDQITGQCPCKPGAEGALDCSKCESGYYDLGPNGCKKCRCSNRAIDLICDPETGRCRCGENVIGETCDQCTAGHYWNATGSNCLSCDCGPGTKLSGTLRKAADCDMNTGQCRCAPHVIGRQCNECEPGYFGVTEEGCKVCPSCPNGQVCDQKTGKCICPPNTQGDRCEECTPGSWDYNPITGCKLCNCSDVGAEPDSAESCDLQSGQCACKSGFTGRACNECEAGHYGYPHCEKCDCDPNGTLRQNDTVVTVTACNKTDGSCLCKPNVQGERCDQCKPGTFGLSIDYPLGCYTCFCFPTTAPPKCSALTGFRSVPGKEITFDIINIDNESSPAGALIQPALILGEDVTGDDLTSTNQLSWRFSAHRPTFLEIPELQGSLVRNYGNIIVGIATVCLPSGSCKLIEPQFRYPDEIMLSDSYENSDMAGNLVVHLPYRIDARMIALDGRLHLEYQPAEEARSSLASGYRYIWLREADWVLTRVAGRDTRVRPTRNELMLALLNVTSFSVRLFMPEAEPKFVNVKYVVYDALSDKITYSGVQITSIEKCDCPSTASGDHCEVASSGFYFPGLKLKPGPSIEPGVTPPRRPENIIWNGGVVKCNCHGMSSNCDPITGVCEHCTGNTMGPDCGQCATGYMGDPKLGQPCIKCQCPTDQTNYAITCSVATDNPYHIRAHQCICKEGYSGLRCERCSPGYYGDPTSMIACQPCDCDPAGSRSATCAQDTGLCSCWPGIQGRRCDECAPDHVVDAAKCRDCRGACTGELLEKADEVKSQIDNLNVTSLAYRGLARLGAQVELARKRFSPERQRAEQDLISRAQLLAKQASQLRQQSNLADTRHKAILFSRCAAQQNITGLAKAVGQTRTKMTDWIKRIRELSTTVPDQATLASWLEDARRTHMDLSSINLNKTREWLDEFLRGASKIKTDAEELIKSVQPSRAAVDLERLTAYQDQQRFLLKFHTSQLQRIINATDVAAKDLATAQNRANTLKQAAETAVESSVIETFKANTNKLRGHLEELELLLSKDIDGHLRQADDAIKELNSVQLADPRSTYVPTNLRTQNVEPLEQDAARIASALRPTAKINRTMEAREAYQTIVDNMNKARKATKEAEDSLAISISGQDHAWQDILDRVKQKQSNITKAITNQTEILELQNNTISEAFKQLDRVKTDLSDIENTVTKSLKDTRDAADKAKIVVDSFRDAEPMVHNNSEVIAIQKERLGNLRDRLQKTEHRYAQIQGTAQSTVDQANNTQTGLAKLIDDTEKAVKLLDAKLLRLRRLADQARSMLDLNYGALAQDPVPLSFGRQCVYTLVPYAITKSRVFDIEFWFRVNDRPNQMGVSSVLIAGRRAFTGRTQMFAFTIEEPQSMLRFSWNVMNGTLEVGPIRQKVWYQTRVTSFAGRTRMMLIERPETGMFGSNFQEASTNAGADHPEAALIVDRQMEIRIGGAIQPASDLVNPEAWGDNGAEALWSRLLSMNSKSGISVCMFNLRLGGVRMNLVNLAAATENCRKPPRFECHLLTYRPLVRDGYVWHVQGHLDALTNETRPARSATPDFQPRRFFYYDYAGTGGYVRLDQLNDLRFCENHLQFTYKALERRKKNEMMLMTFFNFKKDYGVTIELVNDKPRGFLWKGGELYRSEETGKLLDLSESLRRRVLRSAPYRSRLRREIDGPKNEKESFTISRVVDLWRLDSRLSSDCEDEMVLFVGGIPPGQYSLRRRMKELGLTLNPFAGRIGITNDKPDQDGAWFVEEYVSKPVYRFGDTQFTDLTQLGEQLVIENTKPNSQYCLRIFPHDSYKTPELDTSKIGSPWEPGISMTIRFNPRIMSGEDIDLLRIQVQSALWLRIWLTADHRLSIVVPGCDGPLITQEPVSNRPVEDPSYALRDLENAEAEMINASLPAWREDYTHWRKSLTPETPAGEMEVAISLHFGGEDSKQLYVLYDQRVVQSWTVSQLKSQGVVEQVYVGPQDGKSYPISINYLVIGGHLVDFARELSETDQGHGIEVGVCGGQLHPRFYERPGAVKPTLVYQGLDLPPPPGGRMLRFVSSEAFNTTPKVTSTPITDTNGRLRRLEDCTQRPEHTAWFDQTTNSYWQLTDLPSDTEDGPLDITIGFRAQLTRQLRDMEWTAGDWDTTSAYSLLATLNFGPEYGNLNIILSESQIFLSNINGLLWASPHLTIADTNWHQLKLTFPTDTYEIESDGPNVESGVHMVFDGRHLWLPKIILTDLPTLAFIGGSPSLPRFSPVPGKDMVRTSGLFGCVDQLIFNGKDFDPNTSGRPACYDCFGLAPNVVHVPASVEEHLKSNLIELEVPDTFLQDGLDQLTFDFSFFYNRESVTVASLFVFTFQGDETLSRLWLYVTDREVTMIATEEDGSLSDFNSKSAVLFNLPRSKNTWHFVKLEMLFRNGLAAFFLRSQASSALPLTPSPNIERLKSIHFSHDRTLTPEVMSQTLSGVEVHPFTGCIREMRLSSKTDIQYIKFPSGITGLLERVCYTSAVW
ncbi:unnamed protein product [Calicophoron daubneyi]|uniref:Laminin subunit alpha-1 n=1 Tax=Calicophoron daubneyi TaxID=300641 RepID=A0AAV2TC11_CALDB